MKKGLMMVIGAAMLMSSCGTYTATGAYTGGQLGHVIGSAIGGISGGWDGHNVGSLIGTVGGVAAGAAIGSAIDHSQQRKYEQMQDARSNDRSYNRQRHNPSGQRYDRGVDNPSGYDPQGRGDDRITFMEDYASSALEIRNPMILETERDGVLTRGEELTVVFEVINNQDRPAYNVVPMVAETTGNKHIHISPDVRVESIPARQGIRYTARLQADQGLKKGEVVVRIGVAMDGKVIDSQTADYSVPTAKFAEGR
ncbi:MAG: hypothetical protein IJV24_05450 [Prevotella sp.]|nr:hypothetical protein [Prevotella sp.]